MYGFTYFLLTLFKSALHYLVLFLFSYLCRRLASEGVVMLGVTLCVCVSAALVSAAKVMCCIQCSLIILHCYFLRRCLASEGIVMLVVALCVCVRRRCLGGEGNAPYPVLSSYSLLLIIGLIGLGLERSNVYLEVSDLLSSLQL